MCDPSVSESLNLPKQLSEDNDVRQATALQRLCVIQQKWQVRDFSEDYCRIWILKESCLPKVDEWLSFQKSALLLCIYGLLSPLCRHINCTSTIMGLRGESILQRY